MEEFKNFRDVRELLHQYEGVVAACLSIAFEENLLQFNHDGAYNNSFDNNNEPMVSKVLTHSVIYTFTLFTHYSLLHSLQYSRCYLLEVTNQ